MTQEQQSQLVENLAVIAAFTLQKTDKEETKPVALVADFSKAFNEALENPVNPEDATEAIFEVLELAAEQTPSELDNRLVDATRNVLSLLDGKIDFEEWFKNIRARISERAAKRETKREERKAAQTAIARKPKRRGLLGNIGSF